jgi:hypothetical protein
VIIAVAEALGAQLGLTITPGALSWKICEVPHSGSYHQCYILEQRLKCGSVAGILEIAAFKVSHMSDIDDGLSRNWCAAGVCNNDAATSFEASLL